MKLSEFISKDGLYISKFTQNNTFKYIDGSEAYLYSIFLKIRDKSHFSNEIKTKIKDWASLYHLSPDRANILRCFNIENKDIKILELGAGCGAITRYLGENFSSVYVVEGDINRSKIIRLRCSDLDNVKVFVANLFELEPEEDFDIVLLIGVLEYSTLGIKNDTNFRFSSASKLLELAYKFLKKDGLLILAIENKLGIKYLSGANEDHTGKLFEGIQGYPREGTPITFNRKEIKLLLDNAGFKDLEFYLPFPDYKLASVIINAQYSSLSDYYIYNWIETPFPDRTTTKRAILFNESLFLREIVRADLLTDLSNSFLILAYKGNKSTTTEKIKLDREWIARKYSLDRLPNFMKEVTLKHINSDKIVNKRIFPNTPPLNGPLSIELEDTSYIRGELLTYKIFEQIYNNNFLNFIIETMKRLKEILLSHYSTGLLDQEGYPLISGKALDFTFFNIIVDDKDNWYPIDLEWRFDFDIPIDYIIFRNLYTLFDRYEKYLNLGINFDNFIVKIMNELFTDYRLERIKKNIELEKTFGNLVLQAFYKSTNKVYTLKKRNSLTSIIIVTYNSSSTITKCLNSIISNTSDIPIEIIIVDNNSKDDTVKICKDILSKVNVPFKIIENQKNIGYSAGANRGVEASNGEFIVFMNPDVFVYKGWLSEMLKYFEIENVGAVGPISDYVAGLQKFQLYTKQEVHSGLDNLSKSILIQNKGKMVESKLLIGFCLLTKRDILNKVGLFDENLFLGNDDLDFSWRLQINNYKLIIATDVFVHHEGQVSFRSEPSNKTELLVQESTNYLYKKLREYYKGLPQNPMELWGINWFTPYTSLTSIIILTLNNLDYTKMCIESIRRYTPEPYELIVVDNGSKDGTIEYLEGQTDIKLVKNPTNVGFAMGNNMGMKLAKGEYIVILNNDTIVTQGWLTRLIACAKSDPSIGIVGPKSNYVAGIQLIKDVPYGDDMNAMQEFARQWSLENSGRYEETVRVIGFCMLIKREVIEKIGGFDPLYESGNFEDDDFCIRAIRAGFKIKIAHDVFIHHFGSKTFASEKINYTEAMFKNWERFKKKWGIPANWSLERGIPILELSRDGFDINTHYVPLDITPIRIEGMRSKNFLGKLNLATVKWFLENYELEDDVALILYELDSDYAYNKLLELVEKLGYNPESIPDIIIYSNNLSRFEEPRLIASVDGIISASQINEEWLGWAKRLGKEIIEV